MEGRMAVRNSECVEGAVDADAIRQQVSCEGVVQCMRCDALAEPGLRTSLPGRFTEGDRPLGHSGLPEVVFVRHEGLQTPFGHSKTTSGVYRKTTSASTEKLSILNNRFCLNRLPISDLNVQPEVVHSRILEDRRELK